MQPRPPTAHGDYQLITHLCLEPLQHEPLLVLLLLQRVELVPCQSSAPGLPSLGLGQLQVQGAVFCKTRVQKKKIFSWKCEVCMLTIKSKMCQEWAGRLSLPLPGAGAEYHLLQQWTVHVGTHSAVQVGAW